jgi:hypothetical protein
MLQDQRTIFQKLSHFEPRYGTSVISNAQLKMLHQNFQTWKIFPEFQSFQENSKHSTDYFFRFFQMWTRIDSQAWHHHGLRAWVHPWPWLQDRLHLPEPEVYREAWPLQPFTLWTWSHLHGQQLGQPHLQANFCEFTNVNTDILEWLALSLHGKQGPITLYIVKNPIFLGSNWVSRYCIKLVSEKSEKCKMFQIWNWYSF